MATEHQIQANRANAKRSAGPITEVGKQASSQNGRRPATFGERAIALLAQPQGERMIRHQLGKLGESVQLRCSKKSKIAKRTQQAVENTENRNKSEIYFARIQFAYSIGAKTSRYPSSPGRLRSIHNADGNRRSVKILWTGRRSQSAHNDSRAEPFVVKGTPNGRRPATFGERALALLAQPEGERMIRHQLGKLGESVHLRCSKKSKIAKRTHQAVENTKTAINRELSLQESNLNIRFGAKTSRYPSSPGRLRSNHNANGNRRSVKILWTARRSQSA